MNVKGYDDVDNLNTDTLYIFLEDAIEKQLKTDHTVHGGFGTYIDDVCAPNKYLAFTFFKDFDIDEKYNSAVYMSKVAINPTYKSNGLGAKVLKYALDMCKSKGYSIVYFRVDKNNICLDENKNKKYIGDYYKKYAGAEKVADVPELFTNGGEIYKIVLDEMKAAVAEDLVYINEIKKMPEDFYKGKM